MKKMIVAGLIAVSGITSAYAWGPHEQGILQGMAGLWVYQQLSRPQVIVQPQPQVVYQQQTYPQVYPQPEYRAMPQYSPAYPSPYGYSCIPAYTQQGQYIGCVR
jgi:hypothetical protein